VIRVVVADDQALVRGGFQLILDAQEDVQVVGEAEDGKAAVAAVRELRPDVVLMDVRMPVMDGIAATRLIVSQDMASRVLVLTTFDQDEIVYDAMKAGASGFLLKSVPPARLVDGVRTIASGEALLAPAITRRLVEQYVSRPRPGTDVPPQVADLTDRERAVLEMIARGYSNAEIAQRLVVTPSTVKTHVNRIFAKLGLRDRVQAVVLAYESGLVQPGEPSQHSPA
jgi:DNA-binding NarL/FixJ family response regulator